MSNQSFLCQPLQDEKEAQNTAAMQEKKEDQGEDKEEQHETKNVRKRKKDKRTGSKRKRSKKEQWTNC